MKLHQRAYLYLDGKRMGYAVPMRDSIFRKPWAWVTYDMVGNRLGVTASLAEAKRLCYDREYRRLLVCD